MTINKNTDLEFSLQEGTEKGGVYTNFYTEDKGTASIRIRLSNNNYYFDLTKTDLKPVLFLFHEDGSIFEIKDFINVMPDKGLIQYNLSNDVIAHAGKVKAKLFLKNTEQSVHVANFTFDIKDSGIEGEVAKEIKVEMLEDVVRNIMTDNAMGLLDDEYKEKINQDVVDYVASNPDKFKGPKGDNGEQGLQGEQGPPGVKGDPGETPDITEYQNEMEFANKKLNEKSFMNFLNENSAKTNNNKISLSSDRNIKIDLPLNNNEKFILNMSKNNNDDFIKFRNADYEFISGQSTTGSEPVTLRSNFDPNKVTGGSLSGSGDNFYATTIGTKITFDFKGTDINFRYYSDTRGGVWKVTIDGEFIKFVSTHSNNQNPAQNLGSVVYYNQLATNLSNDNHTLVLEFVGQDDSNPVSSPRGWVRTTSETSNEMLKFETFEYKTSGENGTVITQNVLYDSNKEFAFDVSYNNTREWIPEHNNTGTLKLSDTGKQSLFIDGVEFPINEALTGKTFTEVKILQNLFGINSGNGDKVCQLICVTTITSQGVKFNTKLTWLKELTINSGYVNMFTLNPKFASTLITSYDTKHQLNKYDNSYVYLTEKAPYSYAAVSDTFTDVYLTCDNINGRETLRMDYSDRDGDRYGNGLFALQHRNDVLQKLYPKVYKKHVTGVNEVYKFEGFFGFGKLPMVNDILG